MRISIDPRFPLIPNQGYLPNYFTTKNYIDTTKNDQIIGGAIVSGSFQGFDQSYLIQSLRELGKNFVGITNLPEHFTDEYITYLSTHNIKAVRFNLKRTTAKDIERVAKRVFEIARWHSEFYLNADSLDFLKPILANLPSYSIDHLGISKTNSKDLLKLVEKGAKVKATGFGRVDFDVREFLKSIMKANDKALMFGTDHPSTRACVPFSAKDVDLIYQTFDEVKQIENIFYKNALEFYRLKEKDLVRG